MLPALYGATTFLSAFLIFIVQPMLGKKILPWFGGTSAVWNTVMLFFITVLIAGYAYAFGVTKRSSDTSMHIHKILCLVFAFLFIFGWLVYGETPIAPAFSLLGVIQNPVLSILAMLLFGIGLPYAFLGSTSTLLQSWWSTTFGTAPYRLYSLSNFGSLLGLLAYPFVVEPLFTTNTQLTLWSLGFLLTLGLLALISLQQSSRTASSEETLAHISPPVSRLGTRLSWFLLAALPSALLLSATERITTSIAPVPFLWLLPLGAYLCAFIIAWLGWRKWPLPFISIVFMWSAFVILVLEKQVLTALDMASVIVLSTIVLFLSSFLCAHFLYQTRPHESGLPAFYLMIALGGAFGALLVSVVAPLIFTNYAEFPILFGLSLILGAWELLKGLADSVRERRFLFGSLFLFFLLFGVALSNASSPGLYAHRNFYGTLLITTGDAGYGAYKVLSNGSIRHGTQFIDAKMSKLPTTYYTEESGVGLAIDSQRKKKKNLRIGVVGLGTGTLATYCKKGDAFTFYDINPAVIEVARTQFSYLAICPQAEVKEGDARLTLEKEREDKEERYDLLAVDAFSDDAIPVHLLTKEAVELYRARVREDGIIALHISNRYLDLAQIVASISKATGLFAVEVTAKGDKYPDRSTTSDWVLLASDEAILTKPKLSETQTSLDGREGRLWTDQYSNLFGVLKL